MKTLKDSINEAKQQQYRASFIGCINDGVPVSVTILVDKEDVKAFEKYALDEIDNIFGNVDGGNIEWQ